MVLVKRQDKSVSRVTWQHSPRCSSAEVDSSSALHHLSQELLTGETSSLMMSLQSPSIPPSNAPASIAVWRESSGAIHHQRLLSPGRDCMRLIYIHGRQNTNEGCINCWENPAHCSTVWKDNSVLTLLNKHPRPTQLGTSKRTFNLSIQRSSSSAVSS